MALAASSNSGSSMGAATRCPTFTFRSSAACSLPNLAQACANGEVSAMDSAASSLMRAAVKRSCLLYTSDAADDM
eukprot:956102-Alexandrium_andersonii.AAC.1